MQALIGWQENVKIYLLSRMDHIQTYHHGKHPFSIISPNVHQPVAAPSRFKQTQYSQPATWRPVQAPLIIYYLYEAYSRLGNRFGSCLDRIYDISHASMHSYVTKTAQKYVSYSKCLCSRHHVGQRWPLKFLSAGRHTESADVRSEHFSGKIQRPTLGGGRVCSGSKRSVGKNYVHKYMYGLSTRAFAASGLLSYFIFLSQQLLVACLPHM